MLNGREQTSLRETVVVSNDDWDLLASHMNVGFAVGEMERMSESEREMRDGDLVR